MVALHLGPFLSCTCLSQTRSKSCLKGSLPSPPSPREDLPRQGLPTWEEKNQSIQLISCPHHGEDNCRRTQSHIFAWLSLLSGGCNLTCSVTCKCRLRRRDVQAPDLQLQLRGYRYVTLHPLICSVRKKANKPDTFV